MKIAICTSEKSYGKALSEYIMEKNTKWTVDYLPECPDIKVLKEGYNLALLGESYQQEEVFTYLQQETLSLKILWLVKDSYDQHIPSEKILYQYQKAEAILRSIHSSLSEHCPNIEKKKVRKLNIVGICMPDNAYERFLFGLALAMARKNQGQVYYITFVPHSGIASLSEDGLLGDISDVLFATQERLLNIGEKFRSLLLEFQDIYYIQPLKNPEILWEVEEKDIELFMDALEHEVQGTLIVELPDYRPSFRPLLQRMEEVYEKEAENLVEAESVKVLKKQQEMYENVEIESKVKRILLPKASAKSSVMELKESGILGQWVEYFQKRGVFYGKT